MTKQIRFLTMLAMLILTSVMVNAQGLTTAAINGKVFDSKGESLPGATVVALHTSSGTTYGTTTRPDGGFDLPAMRIGGPYKITISFVGFKEYIEENVSLALGENRDYNVTLQEESVTLGELVVVGVADKTFNSSRTGAASNITTNQIAKIPTISRSITDMTRLTPQSSGNNFAGRSNLYNNLSIDGSVFNNSFGLASTPGGQTNAQPISLDAIEEIQVSLAPYDVRQSGFTGAGINAITRSGTNNVEGSVYTFWRNQNLVGDKVGNTAVTNNNFKQKQMGFRVGGPIINNKAFFFVNAEIERRDDPAHTFLASRPGLTGANVSNVQAADLDALRDFLITKYNYDAGSYENYKANTYNDKFLIRLDYNLSKNHKFSLRYNYLKSWRDVVTNALSNAAGSRAASAACLPFSNGGYKINNNINSIVGELNSVFGNYASNNFIIGWTGLRDFRSSSSSPFPMVDILSGGATWTSFGYEQFTANNTLNTDVFQISDNFTLYKGKHTLTAGVSFESFKFKNGFMPQYYGYYRFNSLADFYTSANGGTNPIPIYQLQYSAIAGDPKPYAKLNAAQMGIYVQDEWKALKGLKVTFGLRVDMPFYPSSLTVNPALGPLVFKDPNGNDENIDVSKLPKVTPLFSPRVGFNYDIFGNRKTQLRGGVGIFTGRIPFVWLSNQASNNGLLWGKTDNRNLNVNQFNPDVNAYVPATATALASYEINATVQNFKFPQVLRANFAVDQKLPYDMVGTFEGIFSKEINGVFHRNANLPIAAANVNDPSGRNLYPANTPGITGNRINQTITAAYVMDNSNKGYSYFLTAQLTKKFAFGLDLLASYTYSKTLDLTSNLNATASSGFGQNHIASNPNQLTLGNSSFDQPHKLIGSINYKINYLKHFSTGVSLIYIGSRGSRFDYYYAGDINRDGQNNDLIYVPKDAGDIILIPQATAGALVDTRTPAEIWDQLNAYIEQDDYLKNHRGEVVDRNSNILPWVNQFDLRFTQDINLKINNKVNTFEFTVDIINVGNLLNSDWGVKDVVTKQQFLQFRSFNASNTPSFSFPYLDFANKVPLTKSFTNDTGLNSRWQIQLGVRYIFE